MQRPFGVTVIAVLLWLTGAVNVISGISVMDELSTAAGLIQIVIGAAAVVFGIGCWRLREWAWLGTIVLMGINALSIVVILIQYGDRIIVGRIVCPLLTNVGVIAYLLQPRVQAAFRE